MTLDGNGLPVGHQQAKDAAAKELMDLVNELPGSIYHLGETDAEWVTGRVLERYLIALRQGMRRVS